MFGADTCTKWRGKKKAQTDEKNINVSDGFKLQEEKLFKSEQYQS